MVVGNTLTTVEITVEVGNKGYKRRTWIVCHNPVVINQGRREEWR
jgi:hypothetical protein